MKFTREQRLEIGRKIYVGKITKTEASITYNIDPSTARAYMRDIIETKMDYRRGAME